MVVMSGDAFFLRLMGILQLIKDENADMNAQNHAALIIWETALLSRINAFGHKEASAVIIDQ